MSKPNYKTYKQKKRKERKKYIRLKKNKQLRNLTQKIKKKKKIFRENRLPLYTSVDKASEDRRNPRTLESPSPKADHPR